MDNVGDQLKREERAGNINMFHNLAYILDKERLEILKKCNIGEIKEVFESLKQKESSVHTLSTSTPISENATIFDLQDALKKLVENTVTEKLSEKGNVLSMEEIVTNVSPIFDNKIEFSEEFIQKVPNDELSTKDKVLLLMVYMLHNTYF